MCCLDIWWNWEGLRWPNCKFPSLPCSHRSSSQTTLFIKGKRHSSCLSLSSEFQFPVNLQNFSSKPITSSHGNQGHLTLLILWSLPLTAFCYANPVWPCMACGVLLLQICEYMVSKLLSISSVQCQVLWVQPSL